MKSLVLLVLVVVSAVAVVYCKHRTRVLFREMQQWEQRVDAHETEWGQLQLERRTLAEASRIEHLAREVLGMRYPAHDDVLYLKKP